MTVAWLVSLKYKNASMSDIPWTFGFSIIYLVLLLLSGNKSTAHLVMLSMVFLWSTRLGVHLALRILKNPYHEDLRFKKIRASATVNETLYIYGVFQFQAVLQSFLSIVFIICASNDGLKFQTLQAVSVVFFIISFICQWLSDKQLADFAAGDNTRQACQVCQTGFWKYSRHPNYFFEWCIWLAFGFYSLNSPFGIFALISPVLIYFILTELSGIKLSEEVSLTKRGDGYRQYQQSTSAFFPLPPHNKDLEK